jgi:hypothetical protein
VPLPPQNFYNLFSMLRFGLIKDLISLHAFESIYSRASRFFQTERLRRVFTFASMSVASENGPHWAVGTSEADSARGMMIQVHGNESV